MGKCTFLPLSLFSLPSPPREHFPPLLLKKFPNTSDLFYTQILYPYLLYIIWIPTRSLLYLLHLIHIIHYTTSDLFYYTLDLYHIHINIKLYSYCSFHTDILTYCQFHYNNYRIYISPLYIIALPLTSDLSYPYLVNA